jgi:hypothetical protein
MKNVVAVLALLLVSTTSAYAGSQCINSHDGTLEARKNHRVGPNHTLYGDICNSWRPPVWRPVPRVTTPPTQRHGSRWQLCINGIDISNGGHCSVNDHTWWHHGDRARPITLKGPQAFDVLRRGSILSTNRNWEGWTTYLVKYFGHHERHSNGTRHSRLYNCRVSPNGNWAECMSTTY